MPGNGPAPAARGLRAAWRRRGPLACALFPLSLLYRALLGLHRLPYALGFRRAGQAGIPVIVVGNVIAGGAGKTPVTLALARHLRDSGWSPGIVSRGYGRSTDDCREATPESAPADVGDEPALLARASGVPVFVARKRIEAVQALRARHTQVDVVISDDGLQHLALARDIELCVFNEDGIGNGWLLPAGPLREPWPRPVTAVLHAGACPPMDAPAFAMHRQLAAEGVNAHGERIPLAALRGRPVEAVAAVARPEAFFSMLATEQGLALEHAQALPDHYNFESFQRLGRNEDPLVCTEKDAVKLWRTHPQAWSIALQLQLPPDFWALLDQRLQALRRPRA
ncbi:tetraacyldisaccharide 4'-kinase [Delftia sp. NA_296.1]|uniref:tetraacyldisaccharide 4'-kinase n=1 Tax=Delftia sp. NA_296.1 TaxID=3415648 RepID=UPI0040459799